MFLFFNHNIASIPSKTDTVIIITNPQGFSCIGTLTFIPQKLAIIVGIDNTIVIEVKNLDYSSLKKENLDKIIEVANNQL
mgnify:CR=1 FL=1